MHDNITLDQVEIGFDIIPNGIGASKNEEIELKFTLLSTILDSESYYSNQIPINYANLKLLKERTEEIINKCRICISQVSNNVEITKQCSNIEGIKFYELDKWKQYILPSEKETHIGIYLKEKRKSNSAETRAVKKEDDIEVIEPQLLYDPFSSEYENPDSPSKQIIANGIEDLSFEKREALIDDISRKLRKRNAQQINKFQQSKQVDRSINDSQLKPVIYFHDILETIFKEPLLGRYFGLLCDISFSVPISIFSAGSFSQFSLSIKSNSLLENIYYDTGTNNLSVKDYFLYKNNNGINSKYYHGLKDFGLLKVVQSNKSKGLKWRKNELITSAAKGVIADSEVKRPESDLTDFHIAEIPSVEGIIVQYDRNRITNKNEQIFTNLELTNLENILGYNVVTKKNIKVGNQVQSDKFFSLGSRYSILKSKSETLNYQEEEGWFLLNSKFSVEGTNQTYIVPKLFNWEGQNMNVPKLKLDKYEDYNADSNEGSKYTWYDPLDQYQSNVANYLEYIKGIKLRHNLVPGSNTMLSSGSDNYEHSYKYVIRKVYSNGYTFPTYRKSTSSELTLSDLKLEEYYLSDGEEGAYRILVQDMPIKAPNIVSPNSMWIKAQDPGEDAKAELTLRSENGQNKLKKRLFPSRISIESLQLLGYLEPYHFDENIKKKDYVDFVCDLATKWDTRKCILSRKEIKYLSDPRGKYLFVTCQNIYANNKFESVFDSNSAFKTIIKLYDFKPGLSLYENIEALDIVVEKGSTIQFLFNEEDKEIVMKVPSASQYLLRFHLLDDNMSQQLKDISSTKDLVPKIKELISYYPFTTLKVSYIQKAPSSPYITEERDRNPSAALRPSPASDLDQHEIFYELSVKEDHTRSYFDIDYKFREYVDKVNNTPLLPKQKGTTSLFEHEYQDEIFTLDNDNQIEPNVYLNNFGIEFKCDSQYFGDTQLNIPHEEYLFRFAINREVVIVLKTSGLYINKEVLIAIDSFEGNCTMLFQYEYDIYKGIKLKLNVKIDKVSFNNHELNNIKLNNIIQDPFILYKNIGLPSKDLNAAHLSLNKRLEHLFLYSAALKLNSSNKIQFVYPDIAVSKTHFVLSRLDTKGYLDKSFRLRAQSRFQVNYKNAKIEDFISYNERSSSSDIVHKVHFLNLLTPSKPQFNIIPIVNQTLEKTKIRGKEEYISVRSFSILFEIDRPWFETGEGEFFGLVLQEGDVNDSGNSNSTTETKNTCSIGRDITSNKGSILNFEENIDNSFSNSPELHPYYKKYFAKDDDLHSSILTVYINSKIYRVLLLKPYYHAKKDKWIASLRFSENNISNEDIYSYFVRITAARIQIQNYKDLDSKDLVPKISELTLPKYIPLHAQRVIRVALQSKKKITVHVEKSLKKYDEELRSHFLAYFSKNKEFINLKASHHKDVDLKVKLDIGEHTDFKDVIPWSTSDFDLSDYNYLYILEYESYDNLTKEDLDSLFNNSKFRLVYSEKLKI